MNQRRLLHRLRLVIYGLLVSMVGYGLFRYDIVELPAEGCSPVRDYAPGDRLVVDVRPGRVGIGDVVLYRGGTDLLLGRVSEIPPSAPPEYWEAVSSGALWILAERADCPGDDSRLLGPIDSRAVEGRVMLALPW